MYGQQQNGAYHRIKVVLDANSIFLCLEQSAFAYYDSDLAKTFPGAATLKNLPCITAAICD